MSKCHIVGNHMSQLNYDDYDQEEEDSYKVNCSCRKLSSRRFMIQCDFCDEWYHGWCVNLTTTNALVIDRSTCSGSKGGK